jgi:hypothetical protein
LQFGKFVTQDDLLPAMAANCRGYLSPSMNYASPSGLASVTGLSTVRLKTEDNQRPVAQFEPLRIGFGK